MSESGMPACAGMTVYSRKNITMAEPEKKSWHDNLPFPKHWLGYVALKVIVLALAIYVVLRWSGLL